MRNAAITAMTEMLVPVDLRPASARSVAVAGRIAGRLGLPIRLMSVSNEVEETSTQLRSLADRLLPDREVVIAAVPGGDPAEAIVASAGSSSLVCMATAAKLRPHQGHFGSVAETVVRELTQPVFLIGPEVDLEPGQPTQRVIVPVDGSELSEQSLDLAGDFARQLGVEVWVVSAVPQRTEIAAGALVGHVFAAEFGLVKRLAEDLEERYGVRAGYDVLHMDDPAQAIVDFAGREGTVVMCTHGRSGFSRIFSGSVTHGVVAHSRRPVVVWRPDDT